MSEMFEQVYQSFYRVERRGAHILSDDGGPFGFDIDAALQIHYLITQYKCDAIFETGTFAADTTEYLARMYPNTPIITCDVVEEYVVAARERLARYANVEIVHDSSQAVVTLRVGKYERPFVYLDAHWYDYWPLDDEMKAIDRGVVCIDDFDVGHPRYAFDVYKGRVCGPDMLKRFYEKIPTFYVNNPEARYPFPSLQPKRRGGKCYYVVGLDQTPIANSDFFLRRENSRE